MAALIAALNLTSVLTSMSAACAALVTPGWHNSPYASKGCGKPLATGLTQGGTGMSNSLTMTQSDGTKRSFLLHIPANYDPYRARGMIWSFHGRNGTSVEQEQLTLFSDPFFNPDMIVVYPQALEGPDDETEWQGDPDADEDVDDIGFTLELLDSLTDSYCIDESKVYMSGKSNGGGFTAGVCACDRNCSTKFAAFAAASGAYYQNIGASESKCDADTVDITCNPGRSNIPIITTHGGDDETIPYDGGYRRGGCLPSIPHFMSSWAQLNDMSSKNDTDPLYNKHVFQYVFGNGSDTGLVQNYYVPNMGHDWPSTVWNLDNRADSSPTYFNATPLFISFFNQYSLPMNASD